MSNATPGGRRPPWLRRIVGCFSGAYAIALLLLAAWQHWLPGEFAPLTLVAAFLPLLFAPLLLLAPAAWAARARWSLALQGAALGVGLFVYGPRFVPPAWRVAPPRDDEVTITTMTYNLRYLYHRPDELAEAILAQEADIVALQELTPYAQSALRAALSERYPYDALPGWQSDVALFSRYPIASARWRTLANKPGGALIAEVTVQGKAWRIIAVHPYSPRQYRVLGMGLPLGVSYRDLDLELATLLDASLADGLPLVLLGDFNASEQSLAYRAARVRLKDAFVEAGQGLGFTFPQGEPWRLPWPLVRIDYVLHSDALRATAANVVCNGISDHCLLLAELAMPR